MITPRMSGIYEQYRRAQHFLKLSRRCKKPTSIFSHLIAAVYPARAIVELMLESAEKQELSDFLNKEIKKSRKDFEQVLAPKLPYYYLLEKIRIHDFHRFGCMPPRPEYHQVFIGGPIKLLTSKGSAAIVVTQKGLESARTGNSSIQEQRPLYNEDGYFFDDESKKYLSLEEILTEYLKSLPQAIADFETLRSG